MSLSRKALIPLIAAATLTGSTLISFTTTGVAGAQPSCADTVVIGVPGTFQGLQHNPGKTDTVSLLGPQVADAVTAIASELDNIVVQFVSYEAVGASWNDAIDAKISYDDSTYQRSKDGGYATARSAVANTNSACPSSKFLLAGYSQGAHIAGDLAQSILHGNGPVDPSKLAGALLIADPGYNGASPRATEFQYDGPKWDDDKFDSSKNVVFKNDDRWNVSGSLGTRAAFNESDPIVSICVFGDFICDTGATTNVATKQWMHDIYGNVNYENSKPLTTWAGKTVAELAKAD